MEVNVDNGGSSLPSNYVTIHDLKQRWLQQQQQQKPSSNTRLKSNPKSNENDDTASKTSNDAVSRSGNELQSPPTPEVERKVLNDSKTLIRLSNEERQTSIINNNKQSRDKNSAKPPRNPRFINNQIPTGETAQSESESEPVVAMKKTRNENGAASKTSNDAVSRSENVLKSPPTAEVERTVLDDSKTVNRVSNEEHQVSFNNNNKQSRNRISSRAPRNPRFIINQILTGQTAQLESEPVEEMKKMRNENDAASKTSNDAVSRSGTVLKLPPTAEVERKVLDDSKTVIRVSNKEQQTSIINNNKQSWNENSSRAPRNPRFITNQIPTGETAEPESEPVEEMKKTKKKKKRKQSRNRIPTKVDELNDETVPIVEDENVVEEIQEQQQVHEGEHQNQNRNWNRKEIRESKHKTAQVVVDQNLVEEIKQHEQVNSGERRNRIRNQKEVREWKHKTAQVVVDQNLVEEIKQHEQVNSGERRNQFRNQKEVRESKHKMAMVVDQNLVEEIKQHEQVNSGERHNQIRNQKEVGESKQKTVPVVVDQNVVDEVVAAAAAVQEIKVIKMSMLNYSSRRGTSSSGSGNGRFHGSKYGQRRSLYRENTKGKMSQMWVKKGESVPNSCI
ncbi:uncharacterized protein [Rutidosis leptorrhynchoides]|uniref:uncharacterized protein n=1 Tax=Rutidosis leptorrhynchoides TaxID=125765 RepID=UPI003A9A6301